MDEWYTPPEILDCVEYFFGDGPWLDPTCSPASPAWYRAARTLTKDEDAIETHWPHGLHVFLNPPYSNPSPFTEKFAEHCVLHWDICGVALLNASTDTRWAQALFKLADFACFVSPRIRFLRERGEDDDGLETVFCPPDVDVELVQPSSPRYSNMLVGFARQASRIDDGHRFRAAFGDLGYCVDL